VNDAAFGAILRRHLKYLDGDAEIPVQAPLRDLGLDSMQAVELLFDLEDELGVVLPDSAMTAETFATAESLWAAIERAADASARVA
jgi:acyl carrier protein